ncbi:carbohydrate ABC transporter permease [Allofournierella sp.]|uniref:carbohydrate ABC transporter permease n=1 Tax=Allofournierella sp. TaxID=1940256 RepID=UPI003AB4F403
MPALKKFRIPPLQSDVAIFKNDKKLRLFLCACILPAAALLVYIVLIPTVQVFSMSLFNQTAMSASRTFAGLENYQYLLQDEYFLQAFFNTFKLMLGVPLVTLALALVMAVIITQSRLKEKKFYRVVMFLPSILSTTVIGMLWTFIYNPNMGLLNNLLEKLGLGFWAHAWLGDPKVALLAVAIVLVWTNAGYYMVMYIAGIDNISPDVYEAATIDGAGEMAKFWRITLPLLTRVIKTTVVLCISTVLSSSFVLVTVMTNGAPAGATSVLLQYMYQQAFTNANYGYAMAIAVVTLTIAFLLSKLSDRLTKND